MTTRRVQVDFDLNSLSEAATPQEAIAAIQTMIDAVPEEFRGALVWNLDQDWDTGWEFEVYYDRSETEAERQHDERMRNEYAAARHREEYEQFQRLKAKYEPNK